MGVVVAIKGSGHCPLALFVSISSKRDMSDLEELLSEAKGLPRLQQARVAAILGSLVADAACKSVARARAS